MTFFIRFLQGEEVYQDVYTLNEFKDMYSNPDISILYAERIVD